MNQNDIDAFFPHNDPQTEHALINTYEHLPHFADRPLSRRERRKAARQAKKRKTKSS